MVVKYSVQVYQRDLFLTGDTHHTYIQLTGTRGSSHKVRLADWSFCRALTNACCCSPCKAQETVEEWEVTCPHSLGVLLFVSLDAPPSITAWYCSRVAVTTPEGRTSVFPCHRFVDGGRTLTLRDAIAKLIFEDMRPELLEQRMNELAYRREVYRWSNYADGLPESIRTDGFLSLPREVQFSISKATQLILTVGEALAELGLQGLLCEEHPWSSMEEIHQVFTEKKTGANKYLEKHWKEDCFFGHQFLNGVNPMLIRRCSQIPPNFPVTDDMVRLSLQRGVSLQDEIERGYIFLVDYERLDGLTPNVINGKQQYLSSPLVLLYLTPKDQLVPIAIQLQQEPSEDTPIFLPSDSQYDWILAKIFVRAADFAEHELNVHFLRTHLLSEVFAMATLRNLPTVHPLYKLLIPHFRYTLEIDTLARSLLISDTGTFTEYTAAGGPGTLSFMRKAAATLTYRSICLPDDITDRGLDSVPNFYYRDDGLRLWNIIYRYVEGVVSYYYHDNYAVIRDSELQSWINEILVFGRLTDDNKGFPKSFSCVDELSYFITMMIFTASAQHAAVNNGQFDYYGFMPNAPLSLQSPPPATKGRCSENTLLATLPDVNVTAHGLATVYLLSRTPRDYVPLGGHTEQHFSEKIPLERLDEFRKELKILGFEIRTRNVHLSLPYNYLNPVNIENSVAR